jgi:hypothetical protein
MGGILFSDFHRLIFNRPLYLRPDAAAELSEKKAICAYPRHSALPSELYLSILAYVNAYKICKVGTDSSPNEI